MRRKWGAALLLTGMACAHAQSPDELRALLERGRGAEAYEAGRRAPQRLGDPAFDLVFGIAAVQSGHAAEGVLALERVLLREPGNEGARLELARGYFVMGDDARAREEFEAALAAGPPPAARRAILEYLAALREREARYRSVFSAFGEIAGGYDSNPRAGVDSPLISLPVLGEVTVPDSGTRVADRTVQASVGFRASVPASARLSLFAAGQADAVRYRDETAFDQDVYAGSAGLAGRIASHAWRLGAARGYQTLGGLAYRRTHGGFADWALEVDERTAISLGAQAGMMNYEGANDIRDSRFAGLAAGWRRGFAFAGRTLVEASVSGGRERGIHDDRQDLSRDLHGARLAVTASPREDWTVGGALHYQRSRYRQPDAVLQTARDDRYGAAEVAITWNVFGPFTLRAEYTEARNDSNLALYQYRRRTAMLRGRYDFR